MQQPNPQHFMKNSIDYWNITESFGAIVIRT